VDIHVPHGSCFRDCPVTLSQGCFTYRHDQVTCCIASNLSGLLAELHVYAECILCISSYCPDITNLLQLLLLWCVLLTLSTFGICWKLKAIHGRLLTDIIWTKQIGNSYHWNKCVWPSSVCIDALGFIQPTTVISRSQCRKFLDVASISVSRWIFLASNCAEWLVET